MKKPPSPRATPETDAVWDDNSRNILTHSRNLERQRDEARERGVMTTTEQLHAYREFHRVDMAMIEAMEKQLAAVTAERDEARKRTAPKTLDELEAVNLRSIVQDQEADISSLKIKLGRQRTELRRLNKTLRVMWDGVRFSHRVDRDMKKAAELDAERTARRALEQYVKSSTPDLQEATRMRDAALALAAKLP